MKEIFFRDILRIRKSGDKSKLNEASLGRVYQHVKRSGDGGSLMLGTAYRADKTKKENQAANRKLLSDIKSQGLGAFKIIGNWRECQDDTIPYEKCPENEKVNSKESVFGVPGASLSFVKKMVRKYNQDAIVYLGPETKGKAFLVWRDGTMDKIGNGDFVPQKIAQGWSRVRGGHWTFEGFDYPAQSSVESIAEQAFNSELIH